MSDDTPLLRRLHELAAPKDGCVSAEQLDAAGITYETAKSLVRRGAMARVARGVYVVGTRELSDRQVIWAALLLAGDGSCASHFTALCLYGLMDHPVSDVWVKAPNRRHSRTLRTLLPMRRTGQPATLRIIAGDVPSEPVLVHGVPTRTAAGAVVDLAGQVHTSAEGRARKRPSTQTAAGDRFRPRRVHPRDVQRVWKEADYRNAIRPAAIERELGQGIPGTSLIRQLQSANPIVSDDDTDVETPQEFTLLDAVLRLGLPRPLTNQPLQLPGATYFPDQFYPGAGLVVEADGGVHKRRARRAADRARDQHMRANGLEVLRFPNETIEADADACAREVAAELERRSRR